MIVAGFSMGSIVAQRVWRQHPDKIEGLVLCATTDRFRSSVTERLFHQGMEVAMFGTRGLSRSRTAVRAARTAAGALDLQPDRHARLGVRGVPQHVSPGRSARRSPPSAGTTPGPGCRRIDVPTAVVVTLKDKVLPPDNQIALARRIPGATIHDIQAGHASCVLESERFVPALLEAVSTVNARRRDFRRSAPAPDTVSSGGSLLPGTPDRGRPSPACRRPS